MDQDSSHRYRSFYEINPSRRNSDIRRVADALLRLKQAFGDDAVSAAVELANKSTLKSCRGCGEWTRHRGGTCQQCHGVMDEFIRREQRRLNS